MTDYELRDKLLDQAIPSSDGKPVNYSKQLSEGLWESQKVQLVDEIEGIPVKRRVSESLASQGSAHAALIRASSIKAIHETKEPMKITWKDLCYDIKIAVPKSKTNEQGNTQFTKKQVLQNCSGYALPGQTLYIMGASGAGKTSLMNALSDRIAINKSCTLTGQRLINDSVPLTSKLFGTCASYVMQDDVIFEYFTVKQALTFAARLKLKVSIEEQDKRVNKLIHNLGLKKCQETMVGSVMKKTISGGERKRTAIGVELITDPSIILLDEPTSGLDSFMAKSICKLLQKIAQEDGKTIISTIHQPSSQAFMYFDRLLLMADGHIVYQGVANMAPSYFTSIGYKFEKFCNPADVFMRILSIEYPKTQKEIDKIENLVSNYKNKLLSNIEQEMIEFKIHVQDVNKKQIHQSDFVNQFTQLWQRVLLFAKLEPSVVRVRIGMTIFNAFLIICCFKNTAGYKTQSEIQNTSGSMFMCMMMLFMQAVFSNVLTFQLERPVFLREHANMMYSLSPYYLTKMLVEIPVLLVLPLIQCLCVYWIIGYQSGIQRFFMQYLVLELLVQCGSALGFTVSSMSENITVATTMAPIVVMPVTLFAGLLVNLKTCFVWLRWIQWLSPMRYCFNALCIAEWGGNPETEQIYQVQLGFGSKLNYNDCVFCMLGIVVVARLMSVAALLYNIKKFQ